MITDARELGVGVVLEADVAVVGAGPAGIVIALELARAGVRVLLIESGNRRFDAEVQRLGDANLADPDRHAPMSQATRRQIGGASVVWGGRCVPFDPIDFDRRRIVADASWPVSYEELTPFFHRACRWFQCGSPVFDARAIPGLRDKTLVPGLPDGTVLTSALERWSLPTNFGREYHRELKRSDRVRLVTGLTCTEVVVGEGGGDVACLTARRMDRSAVSIRAVRYVLAGGGLETTRLLLASDRRTRRGLGNHSGHLGRWYMGHVDGQIARVRFGTPPGETIYGHERDPDGTYVRRRFAFSREFLATENLPNVVAWLRNPELADHTHRSGILSFAYLALTSPLGRFFLSEAIRESLTKSAIPPSHRDHAANILRGLGPTARFVATFGYKRFLVRRRAPGFFVRSDANVYPLHYHGEHLPSFDSRVSLADESDAVGLRRLRIDIRFSRQDIKGVLRAHDFWDEYLRRHRCGTLEYLTNDREAAVRQQAAAGFHQAGTTRMSSRPEDGVVRPDLSVHGFEDLYVASSSTFVTSGQANTTFMIVAFALRLADKLRADLSTARSSCGAPPTASTASSGSSSHWRS